MNNKTLILINGELFESALCETIDEYVNELEITDQKRLKETISKIYNNLQEPL